MVPAVVPAWDDVQIAGYSHVVVVVQSRHISADPKLAPSSSLQAIPPLGGLIARDLPTDLAGGGVVPQLGSLHAADVAPKPEHSTKTSSSLSKPGEMEEPGVEGWWRGGRKTTAATKPKGKGRSRGVDLTQP